MKDKRDSWATREACNSRDWQQLPWPAVQTIIHVMARAVELQY